jgi:hypothetical protein
MSPRYRPSPSTGGETGNVELGLELLDGLDDREMILDLGRRDRAASAGASRDREGSSRSMFAASRRRLGVEATNSTSRNPLAALRAGRRLTSVAARGVVAVVARVARRWKLSVPPHATHTARPALVSDLATLSARGKALAAISCWR